MEEYAPQAAWRHGNRNVAKICHSAGPVQAAGMRETYPPPAFCKKSLQAVENKRSEREKQGQERKRVCKSMRARDLRCVSGREKRRAANTRSVEEEEGNEGGHWPEN